MKDFTAIQDRLEQFGLIPFFESQLRDFFHEVDSEDRLEREVSVLKLFKRLHSRVKEAKEQPVIIPWSDVCEGAESDCDLHDLLQGVVIRPNGDIQLFQNQAEELLLSVFKLLGLPPDRKDQQATLEKATEDLG
ncbi:hypothetical protein DRQ26_06755 [bacterium]|nr:MAG: hypothetical protein DRQ26_06755 [bacterium]